MHTFFLRMQSPTCVNVRENKAVKWNTVVFPDSFSTFPNKNKNIFSKK